MKRLEQALCRALAAHLAGGAPRPPEAGVPLWNAFLALSGTRRHNGTGPEAITFGEIEAWCRLMRVPLQPRHVRIIVALDRVWLQHAFNEASTPVPDGVKTLPPVSAHPLTADLFDVVVG